MKVKVGLFILGLSILVCLSALAKQPPEYGTLTEGHDNEDPLDDKYKNAPTMYPSSAWYTYNEDAPVIQQQPTEQLDKNQAEIYKNIYNKDAQENLTEKIKSFPAFKKYYPPKQKEEKIYKEDHGSLYGKYKPTPIVDPLTNYRD
jgi:hypothetical protein